jgi:hypothetical protein
MDPFSLIALAVLGGSALQANEARKANRAAREMQTLQLQQQERDAAAMREEITRQTAAYGQQAAALQTQAETARQAFQASQLQYQENKLAMENKAKEVQAAADEERRRAAAAEASALKARTRGGRRSLLSQERLTPELGVTGPQLGSGMML